MRGISFAKAAGAPKCVVLVGFMGAGKTSVGRGLAELLGWSFEDLDDRIQRREGSTILELFRASGEAAFRRAEHEALSEFFHDLRAGSHKVVALGGGAFAQKPNADLIKSEVVPTIFLDADVEELWRRCHEQAGSQNTERPLLGTLASFRKLYEERRPQYLKALFRRETVGRTVEEIVREIAQTLGCDAK